MAAKGGALTLLRAARWETLRSASQGRRRSGGPPTVSWARGREPVGGGVQGGSGRVRVCGPLSWQGEPGKHGGGCADLAWGFADLTFLLALEGWRNSEQDTFLPCLVRQNGSGSLRVLGGHCCSGQWI